MAGQQEHIEETSEKIDIGTIVGKVVSHWYLFIIAIPIFLAIGMWKVRFADRTYDVEAQLLIRDSDNKMQGAENLLEGMQMFSAFANIENEIGLIKSTGVINRTLDAVDFEVSYFSQGKVRTIERYHNFPFVVHIDTSRRQLINKAFFVEVIDESSFKIKLNRTEGKTYHYNNRKFDVKQEEPIKFESTFRFGELVQTDYFAFRLERNPDFDTEFGEVQLFFKLNDREKLLNKYKAKTQAKVLNKTASIIVVSLSDVNKQKALDYVNALADAYVMAGLEVKNLMAANTVKFIDNQLKTIADSLNQTENELKSFRSEEKLMDLDFTSMKAFDKLEKFQKDKAELLTKEKYYRYLLGYVTKTSVLDTLVAPSLIGINDPLLSSSLQELHQLNKDKAGLNYNSEAKNPALIKVNARTAEMCKLVENSSRDAAIAFANELSMICDKAGINVWQLTDLANKHPRVNILKPGTGVGGHCIAVDPWFIVSNYPDQAKIIRKSREINNYKTDWALEKVISTSAEFKEEHGRIPKVACMGLAFKPDIDDLRESPALKVVSELLVRDDMEVMPVEPNIKHLQGIDLYPYTEAINEADIVVFLVGHREFFDLDVEDKIVLNFSGVTKVVKEYIM